MSTASAVIIRPRRPSDQGALTALARRERDLGGYPPPGIDLHPEPGWVQSWVAATDGRLSGHVALLHGQTNRVTEYIHRQLDLPVARQAVVKRLVVATETRRRGIGRALMNTMVEHARSQGWHPVLDVWERNTRAIAFYDRLGWRHLGQVEMTYDLDGKPHTIIELIYDLPTRSTRR